MLMTIPLRRARVHDRVPVRSSAESNAPRRAATSHSISRSSNPSTAAFACDVAHLWPCAQPHRWSMAVGAEPMKHLVPEPAELLPDHPALRVRLLRRWLSEALLRAWYRRVKHLGSIPCAKPNRSCATIQVLFCGPELWRTHGKGLTASARATPARSCR